MTEEITPEVIKKTQECLSKFIKKPPLTEKLLKKPPFRFLHDIVTNVINETGFLNGLYNNTELQSENIKDREMKIAFLQKLIDTVKMVSGTKISARPSKIIAGLEPTKTNQLLQTIGLALEKKLDSNAAVQKITGTSPTKKESKPKKEEKIKPRKPEEKKLIRRNTEEKLIAKKKPSPRTEKENRKNSASQNDKRKEKVKRQESETESPKPAPESPKPAPETPKEPEIKPEEVIEPKVEIDQTPKELVSISEEKIEIIPDPKPIEPPIEEPEVMVTKKEAKRPTTSLRPPSVRPSSARPGAPRLKDRNDTILLPDQLVPLGKVKVIVESFNDKADDEETVVLETQPEIAYPIQEAIPQSLPAEKGHLVSQILEQIGDKPLIAPPKAQIQWEQKSGDAGSVKLRESIQTLTRAANPLGKLINFLHEDVDSMQSELKMWNDVNEKLKTEIKTKKRQNEESMKPLQEQLSRLESEIVKQHEMISSTQANILRNQQKIKTLLTRD